MIYGELAPSRKYRMTRESIYLWMQPYDPTFSTRMKEIPIRFYHPDIRKWEIPMVSLPRVMKAFPNLAIEGQSFSDLPSGFNSVEEYEEYIKTLEIEVDYAPKTKMDPVQVHWFNMMLHRGHTLNGDPMGMGKTKEYLDVCEWRKISRGYRKCLFICGAKYKWNMARQVRLHTNSGCQIVDGSREKRLQQMRDFFYSDDYYLIMGYESVALHLDELRLLGINMGFNVVIIDECQKLKNYQERRRDEENPERDNRHITVKIVNLIEGLNPDLILMGTGTPVSKRAEDLYSILRLGGVEGRNIWAFKARYCKFDKYGRVVGYQNLAELRVKLKELMIRRPKELLHLQKPRPEYVALRMGKKQEAFYTACVYQLRSELKGTKAITWTSMTKLLRLRQITSSPALLDSDAPSIKEETIIEMVREAAERGEKSVIFSVYVEEVERLVKALKKLNPAKVIGTMASKKAFDEVQRLQEDPSCMALVGSLLACKESYDMFAAKNVFFLDLSYNWDQNEQAVSRVWRRGQHEQVNIYYLYCEGTVDEAVFEILIRDKRLAQQLVGLEGESVRTFDPDLVERMLRLPSDKEYTPLGDEKIGAD